MQSRMGGQTDERMDRRAASGRVGVDRQSDCGLVGETDRGLTDRPTDGRMEGRRDECREGRCRLGGRAGEKQCAGGHWVRRRDIESAR